MRPFFFAGREIFPVNDKTCHQKKTIALAKKQIRIYNKQVCPEEKSGR